jgi:hypothetical protein
LHGRREIGIELGLDRADLIALLQEQALQRLQRAHLAVLLHPSQQHRSRLSRLQVESAEETSGFLQCLLDFRVLAMLLDKGPKPLLRERR